MLHAGQAWIELTVPGVARRIATELLTVLAAKSRFSAQRTLSGKRDSRDSQRRSAMCADAQPPRAGLVSGAGEKCRSGHKVLHCAYSCAKRTVVMLHHQCLI
jgi:hypothetical protein